MIMDKNSQVRYAQIIKYFSAKSRVEKIPFSGTLELTPRCNMNCKMCYIRMSEEEMKSVGSELPVEEWIRIAREAVDQGMGMVLLTGGEAILYKDFKKLYLELRKMGGFISINTNATMLNREWIEFFKENPPAKFNITVYGGCNETYERLCGNPRGFDQMKAAVEELLGCGFHVLLNCSITRQNVSDTEKIFEFGRAYGLEINATTYAFPPVRKEGQHDPVLNRFEAKEAACARVRLNRVSLGEEKFRERCLKIRDELDTAESLQDECASIEGDKILCAAGRSNFWVTWDGRMLPCGMIPDFSVPVSGKSFKEAWDEITQYTETVRLSSECAGCSKKRICMPCAAKLKAETGSYALKSDYLCGYTDEYIRLMREAVRDNASPDPGNIQG